MLRGATFDSMGIRYFAITIDNDDYERISRGPCPTCGARPHPSDDDELESPAETLDLDKAYWMLHRVFATLDLQKATQLVTGAVTNTPRGWISYQGLVSPDVVREMVDELATVDAETVRRQMLDHRIGYDDDDRVEQDAGYTVEFFQRAKEFLGTAGSRGRGVVYYIG